MNPAADEDKVKFAECFRYIIANPDGKFLVHCREGKERSGMFIAITECLMGASFDEIAADYMTSYRNYYGLKESDPAYRIILNGNLKKSLTDLFGADVQEADLVKEAEEYLSDIGLSFEETVQLERVLSGKSEVCVLIYNITLQILRWFRIIVELIKGLFI